MMTTRFFGVLFFLSLCLTQASRGQQKPYSERMAESFMVSRPDTSANSPRWDYELGLMWKALERVWKRTGDDRYFNYVLHDVDRAIDASGSIHPYKMEDYNLDNVTPGRLLLTLAQLNQAGRDKFRRAADTIRMQLTRQPRTKAKGFWHKQRYPYQMWLDGLYMAEPFYAEYSAVYDQPENFDDIALQFALIEKNLLDPKTGLLYHGYDESREQKWSDPKTGLSPNFWGRSIGWYAIALVDVLDYFPENNPRRADLIRYLQRLMPVVVRYQDKASGCWYQITDQGSRKGNYLEASASCMFVYALAKGVRMGYLPATMLENAKRGYAGILKEFVETDAQGHLHLNGTVSVGGLGVSGGKFRDGSYEYYLSEPIRKDDLKGVGPFVMASIEMEMIDELTVGTNRTVLLDYYFNHEFRKGEKNTQTGKPGPERFHYTWEDQMHSGFWLLGNIFRELGARTASLDAAPTAQNLRNADVYIIVDPDTPKETAKPNYISPAASTVIENWVKAGGVLVLMANDTANSEIRHLNELAARFGMHFDDELINHVVGTQWEGGKLDIPAGNAVFPTTQIIYMKDIAPLTLTKPAQPLLMGANGKVAIATAKVGKGTVFAVGDPWLYNEYTDGRHIPARYQNFRAGKELATWLLRQCPPKK